MSNKRQYASTDTSQPVQLDIFGGITPPKYTPKKPAKDKRLEDFYKRHTKALAPYALVMTFNESDVPVISDEHQIDSFNETEMRIARMCEFWGMRRTFANEGLVASGNGKFLHRLVYGDVHPSRKG